MDNDHPKIKPSKRTNIVQEYYFSRKLKEIDVMRKNGANIISLGIGGPDLPPAAETIHTLTHEAQQNHTHGYQSYIGIPELREAYSNWYQRFYKVSLSPTNEILPLIGSKEGIMHITMAFVNEGDEVLVPNPGYPTYTSVTNLVGGKIREYTLSEANNWMPDLSALTQTDLTNVKMMWVNYPHMPTGTKGNIKLFEQLIAFGLKHNILICNDNPYSFILNNEYTSIFQVPEAKQTALELNSLSKSHNMAGWRIGMVAGHPYFINEIIKVKSNMDSGMFQPIQKAAVTALNCDNDWYNKLNNIYSKRRTLAEDIMNILQCTFNKEQVGLFVWGKIPDSYINAEELTEKLLHQAHVFITPGFIFGSAGERYIRISLCANEDAFVEAKERIKNCISN